jgi:hypothetical protein
MKKTLLLQTALVAAAGLFVADIASAQVKAEPLAVTVGGYYTQFYKAQDRGNTQIDQATQSFSSDAEIWFNIRSVLANGTVIGGRVELEAATYSDQIDEAYIFIEKSDIGRVEVGSTDKVSGKMLYFAPGSLPGHSTTVHSEYTAAANTPLMWFANSNHDTQGISLYTASNRYLGSKAGKGIQLGVSYVPDGCEDFNPAGTTGTTAMPGATTGTTTGSNRGCGGGFGSTANIGQFSQQIVGAANYLESFGPVDLALYGAYQSGKPEVRVATTATASGVMNERVSAWQLGSQLTYNVGDGSTIGFGGGYSRENLTEGGTGVAERDRKAYSVGLRYLTNGANAGSIGIGVEYYNREDSNTVVGANAAISSVAATGDQELDYYHLGLTYQIAPGILSFAGVGVSDTDNPGAARDNKQTFGVLGLALNF